MQGKILPLVVSLIGLAVVAQADVILTGKVVSGTNAPVSGVRVSLRLPKSDELAGGRANSDPTGEYIVNAPRPGLYVVDVEREGFFRLANQEIRLVPGVNRVDFVLERQREVFESVDVVATPPLVDLETTVPQDTFTGEHLLSIPYPSTNNLRNALRVVPGVVQDAKGGLHIMGGKEDQVLYTLDGFNISDPLTGRFDTRFSVEAVQSVEITSSRYSAEFGKASAGTLAIHSRSGDDHFRYSATNFIPGMEHRKGWVIGNWTPRLSFSGPLVRSRAWFFNSLDTLYSKNVVKELPKGGDRTTSWRFSNLLSTQANLSPSNILYAGFLVSGWTAPRSGLSVMDPVETTVDRRSRQWFFHVKDQWYMPGRALLEVGYARNRTFGREIPQGEGIYVITPEGKRGHYFVDAARKAARDQALVNFFWPSITAGGSHQLKAGLDLNRVQYWQNARRTGFENYRDNLTRIRRTVFSGSGELSRRNVEAGAYLQDSWKVMPGLLVELGLRLDWDSILSRWSTSPRTGFAWAPKGLANTKISGGVAQLYDATHLSIFTRPRDQYSLTTYFEPNGAITRGPAVSAFTIQDRRLARPAYRNYNLGWEQVWPGGFYTRFDYSRRRGIRGFTYADMLRGQPPPPTLREWFEASVFDALYNLGNNRRDIYDGFEITVRKPFRRQYEWMGSYTRSRTFSNAVVDINVEDPIIVTDNVGRMPWDVPHRLVSWAYLPTFSKEWAVAYLMEWRTGFPFSIVSENNQILGAVNSQRFPNYFELNVHLERRFVFRKYRWALRGGFNNITNHRNPTVVNNNTHSVNFMRLYGGYGRSMNFRIRWLGRL